MLKLITLVGTRPELIRLACVIPELDKHLQQRTGTRTTGGDTYPW